MKFLKELFNLVLDVFIGVFVGLILIKLVLMPCVVDGRSMEPTLQDGQSGFSFSVAKRIGVDRFDISVIKVNSDNEDKLLVKRVIGLPGETVEYKDNKLFINNEYIVEDFLRENTITDDFKIELKDNEYFCLGDNREISRDSRYYGAFTFEQIKSTGFFVVYPFKDFGVKK